MEYVVFYVFLYNVLNVLEYLAATKFPLGNNKLNLTLEHLKEMVHPKL